MLEQRGEVYIKLNTPKGFDYSYLGRQMSLGKVLFTSKGAQIQACLNAKQFEWLKNEQIDFELLTPPSMLKAAAMCSNQSSVKEWDCYPTYSQYITLMESFENNYPELCKLEEFGQSIDRRKLMVLKISDNVSTKEAEPEFFYTATMHGDETAGYVLMLRLIDYLLTNYGTDARVTDLVDNTEIWINPLSNPDGTYAAGDNEITGATRRNANGIDLNRNFPDITDPEGRPGEGSDIEPENAAMIDFMKNHNFVFSANFHGGIEVVNYPWDTWYTYERKHADHVWYQEVCREYADTVHANSTAYMQAFDNGITHGATWYSILGGRQDYVNYYLHGREVTIELSDEYIPEGTLLPALWNYNYRSFLNHINKVHTGIYGKVTDQDGNPVRAKIAIADYDADSSEVYSDASTGMFYRMILGGNYTVSASAPDHNTVEHEVASISDSKVEQNFVLQRYPTGINEDISSYVNILKYQNPIRHSLNFDIDFKQALEYQIELFDTEGKRVKSEKLNGIVGVNKVELNISDVIPGIYFCKIHSKLGSKELKLVKLSD